MARAVAPVVGVVLLVFLTVVLSASVAIAVRGPDHAPEPPPVASFAGEADADSDRVTLIHRGGDTIQVPEVTIHVEIDGEELAHQPPVPFFAAEGFESGPTGPFNSAADGRWRAGERASFAIAGTNDPQLESGADVSVTIATDGAVLAVVEMTAG